MKNHSEMSWYSTPSAKYVVISLDHDYHKNSIAITNVRPCDIRKQLIGFKVSTIHPYNKVKYQSNGKVIHLKVITISVTYDTDERVLEGYISRDSQLFIVRSQCNMAFSFSYDYNNWCFDSHYDENHISRAIHIHDPVLVSTMLGNFFYHSFRFLYCLLV